MYPRTLLLVLATACTLNTAFANTEMTARQTYIDTYKDLAIDQMHRTKIPASIILAQAIYESGNGKGKLAVNANNHFGIKCKDYWIGDTYYLEDDDYDENGNLEKSCFRKYATAEESFRNHGEFLTTTRWYAELFTYENDYKKWAYGLKEIGYATNPKYAKTLINIIEKHELYLLDQEPVKPFVDQLPAITQEQNEEIEATVINMEKPVIMIEKETSEEKLEEEIEEVFEVTLENDLIQSFELIQPVTRKSVEAAQPEIVGITAASFKILPQRPIFRRFKMK